MTSTALSAFLFVLGVALLALALFVNVTSSSSWSRTEIISLAQLIFSVVAFAGAVAGVKVAFNAYKLTDDRTKIEQRGQIVDLADSWVVNRPDDANGPLVSFKISNPGRTPAYVLKGHYEAVTGTTLPERFAEERPFPYPGILRQGQKTQIVIPRHFPPMDVAAIREGRTFLFVRVVIEYRDIFGTRFEMRTTAKYGKTVNADGDEPLGVEFPEALLSPELQKASTGEFVKSRKYNSHKRLED